MLLSTPLSKIFLLFALLPTFLLFSVLTPVCFSSSCCFVRAAVICSSSASKCSCVFCTLPHLRIPFVFVVQVRRTEVFVLIIFFVALSFLVGVFVYPGSSAFDLPTLIIRYQYFVLVLSVSVCDHIICTWYLGCLLYTSPSPRD